MRRIAAAAAALLALAGSAGAAEPTAIAKLLQDGYDVKAAFYDNSGGAYIILQKATSAYLCHSSPNQVCEKLN